MNTYAHPISENDEYKLVFERFAEFKKYGHLRLRFKFQHKETAVRLEAAGFDLAIARGSDDLVYDIVAPPYHRSNSKK